MTDEALKKLTKTISAIAGWYCRRAGSTFHFEELLQEGLLAAHIGDKAGRTVGTGLMREVRFRMQDYLRRVDCANGVSKSERHKAKITGASIPARIVGLHQASRKISAESELSAFLDAPRALAAIPNAIDRAMVRMYYLEEKNLVEIGRAFDLQTTRVSQRVRRGIETARIALAA